MSRHSDWVVVLPVPLEPNEPSIEQLQRVLAPILLHAGQDAQAGTRVQRSVPELLGPQRARRPVRLLLLLIHPLTNEMRTHLLQTGKA